MNMPHPRHSAMLGTAEVRDIFSLGCVFLEILSVILMATLDRNAPDGLRRLTPYSLNIGGMKMGRSPDQG